MVQGVAADLGLPVEIRNLDNPRQELEEHYFNPDRKHLIDLGYQPTQDMKAELRVMLSDLILQRDRIEAKREALIPDVHWNGARGKVQFIQQKTVAMSDPTG